MASEHTNDRHGRLDWVFVQQCLFGEHLLTRYPNRIVALVEAEKTTVFALHVDGILDFIPSPSPRPDALTRRGFYVCRGPQI